MATTVQIELQVDEKGAVSGVRSFDTAVKGSAGSVNGLDASLQKLNAHMDQLASKGAGAGRKAKEALNETGAAALSSREKVKLLSEEFEVHIPRAMVGVLSRSKLVQTALSGIGSAMVGLGLIQIGATAFTQLIDGARKLYDEHLSLTKAAEEYNAELAKTRTADFGNTRSIEDTRARIKSATEDIEALNRGIQYSQNQASHYIKFSLPWMLRTADASRMSQEVVTREKQQAELKSSGADQQHELTLAAIARDHSSAGLPGAAARQANLDRKLAENIENQSFAAEKDKALHNTTSSDAGKEKRAIEDATARKDAAGEAAAAERSQERETMHMQAEAREARLRGEQLYAAQRDAQLAELKFKLKETELSPLQYQRQVAAVQEKFDGERLKRLEDEERKIQEIRGQTQLAGLTGPAHVFQEEKNRVGAIQRDSNLNPGQRLAEIWEAHKQTAQQLAELNKSFADRVDEISGQAASRELSGFARIRSDAENQIRALTRDFKDKGGKQPDLDRGIAAIKQSAGDQSVAMMRQMSDETSSIEAEARAKSLSGERQKTAAIQAEYEARIQRYEDWKRKELSSDLLSDRERSTIIDSANRREVAAARERDAQMVEASKAAREKMAGEFDHLFKSLDHPMEALKEVGDKVAGEAAASLVQKLQQRVNKNGLASPAASEEHTGLFGDVMSSFGLGGGKKNGAIPIFPAGVPQLPGSIASAAASSMFSVSSAVIHVGSASLSFGGGATGPGYVPGAGNGSTSLLGGLLPSSQHGGAASPLSHSTTASTSGGRGLIGGSGDSTVSSPANFSTGSGTPPPVGAGMIGAVNNIGKGYGLFKQAGSIFSGNGSSHAVPQSQHDALSGTLNDDGSFTSDSGSSASGDLSAPSGTTNGASKMDRVAAGAEGAMGLYSAYEGNGGVGGALGGAMSGMQLGMAVAGPMGAAVGAAAGAILGAIGFGGREKARVYDLKQVRPRITTDIDSFQQGSMDYLSAYSDMESTQTDASHTISKLGPAANSYYQDTIKPEIRTAEQKLSREAKAGRSASTFSGAQYALGTDYAPSTGLALIHEGERILPTKQNEQITRALTSGLSVDDAHASYQNTMQSSSASNNSGGDRTLNMHIHAMDSKSVTSLLDEHMDHIRHGLNSSYSSYGGLADA